MVAEHRQSEQGGEVACAEEFAGNGGGRRDGGEPGKSECGGENVEVEVGLGRKNVDEYHRGARGVQSEQDVFAPNAACAPA